MFLIAQIALGVIIGLAQAAEPERLMLACTGTKYPSSEGAPPEPASMGIIINFAAKTVDGLGYDFQWRMFVSDLHINFTGVSPRNENITGHIDRVTGDAEVTYVGPKLGPNDTGIAEYSLKCKPTQRMF